MAVNKQLEDVVLMELFRHTSSIDPGLKRLADDEEVGREIVRMQAQVAVDKPHKVRVHFGNLVGYGYDFTEKADGVTAREIYEHAVESTEKLKGLPNVEQFVKKGVTDNRYGWYITSLKQS